MTTPPPQHPHRLLAIDPGARRTGVAVSDDLGLYAHPRPALAVSGASLVEAVARLAVEEAATELIVGLPLSLSGRDSAQTASARQLARRLKQRLPIPVTEWDERLSTVEASRRVRGAIARQRGLVDSEAAAVVLQAVLDARRLAAR